MKIRIPSARVLGSLKGAAIGGLLALSLLIAPRCLAVSVEIADGGTPSLSVVVKPGASSAVQAAANSLAEKLSEITGGTFSVTTGTGDTGIAVGLGGDFTAPSWPFGGTFFSSTDLFRREEYALRSHSSGIFVGGATEMAVENAVWDLLHRLGYRALNPSPAWEIIPDSPDLDLDIDVVETPDFIDRNMAYHYGVWNDMNTLSGDWRVRNRLRRGVPMSTTHSNYALINRHPAEFAAHPEYLALVNNVRVGPTKYAKFCNSNPGLQALVANDVLTRFAASPSTLCISIEPSDANGHCQCTSCAALGSISDQLVTLANSVASAVQAVYGNTRFVGIYAYNKHSFAPTIPVNSQVIVNVATAYIPGGYTVADLLTGWQLKGATVGVREYFSINAWDHDLPGKARAASTELGKKLKGFYDMGARFITAEVGAGYAPCGLGNYLAARFLWDKNSNTDLIVDDFLTSAFGPAKAPMADFFALINGKNRPLMSTDLVHRMYQKCQDALLLTSDPKIRRRIYDLALYTRYVEMFMVYSDDPSQAGFEEVLKFAYRIRHTYMVSSYALWRDWPGRTGWEVPANCKYNVAEGTNPWKDATPITDLEIDGMITYGIASNPLLPFTPVSFSNELAPADDLGLLTPGAGGFGGFRYAHTFHIWSEGGTSSYDITANNGAISSGILRLNVYDPETSGEGDDDIEAPEPVWSEDTAFGTGTNNFAISLAKEGRYRLHCDDAGSGFNVRPVSVGQEYFTIEASTDSVPRFNGRWNLYFYVPKGTTVVGGYSYGNASDGTDKLVDSNGTTQLVFTTPGYWSVPVPTGQDGKLWKFSQALGRRILMTVPPYMARHADELLLPREVVDRDSTGFIPKSFSDNLVPATALGIPSVTAGNYTRLRGTRVVNVWAPTAGSVFGFNVTNTYHSTTKTLTLQLSSHADEFTTYVDIDTAPANSTAYPVSLTSLEAGHHKIRFMDGNSGYTFPANSSMTGSHMTFSLRSVDGVSFSTGRCNLYFYVPKGTTEVGGYSFGAATDGSEQLRDGSGAIRHVFSGSGFFSVPVPPGQDGKLWKFHQFLGQKTLHTVPPYVARSLEELLLPIEVVNADKP